MLQSLEAEVQALVDKLRKNEQPTPPPPEETDQNESKLRRALKASNSRVQSLEKTVEVLQGKLRTLQTMAASGDRSGATSAASFPASGKSKAAASTKAGSSRAASTTAAAPLLSLNDALGLLGAGGDAFGDTARDLSSDFADGPAAADRRASTGTSASGKRSMGGASSTASAKWPGDGRKAAGPHVLPKSRYGPAPTPTPTPAVTAPPRRPELYETWPHDDVTAPSGPSSSDVGSGKDLLRKRPPASSTHVGGGGGTGTL